MILPHIPKEGRCLACGLTHSDPDALPPEDALVAEDEALRAECPLMRALMLKLFLFLVLPMSYFLLGIWPVLIWAVLGGWFFGYAVSAEEQKWSGLREVRLEYEQLLTVLPNVKRSLYFRQITEAIAPLFPLRDKAFHALQAGAGDQVAEISAQLDSLRARSATEQDPALVEMQRRQLHDLHASREKMRELAHFVERFRTTKECVATSLRLLRSRLVASQTLDAREEKNILSELQLIHDVYRRVHEPAPPAADKPATGAPLPLADEPEEPEDESRRPPRVPTRRPESNG